MSQHQDQSDWSRTPAAAFAAAILGLASLLGIIWSITHTRPQITDPPPQSAAPMALQAPRPIVIHLVDLNSASAAELELLPGIGPVTASSIVQDRAENGPYRTLEELDRVSGIGPKTIERIRDRATIEQD
jgi:competence ComEA-like helix-hairpin-helix protein